VVAQALDRGEDWTFGLEDFLVEQGQHAARRELAVLDS
jgi:hypothetical protein